MNYDIMEADNEVICLERCFESRRDFREWLEQNHSQPEGMWLILGKDGGPTTVSAMDALEEALCFGWIDGQIRRIDDTTYKKYFSPRRKKSPWSTRNKELVKKLHRLGLITPAGEIAIKAAKESGSWNVEFEKITDGQVEDFKELLFGHEPARSHFLKMSPSVQKNYTGFYLSAKREETKVKRFLQIVDRLDKNLKPLE